jgi:type VI secretion system protein ImpE
VANPTTFRFDTSLKESLSAAQVAVRASPTEAAQRTYLFQLQCVLGNWEKALAQLQSAAQFDPSAIPMAQLYREAIRCEVFREDAFAGKRKPNLLGNPPQWLGYLCEALTLAASEKYDEAATLRETALELAPTSAGHMDDTAFDWIADADSRIGPVCEVFMNGQYYWIGFDQIASIAFDAPSDLRDLVWCPATLELRNGGKHPALIPTRYVGSSAVSDECALSRKTAWFEKASDTWIGIGQRMFATDAGEFAQLDVRKITFA